MNIIVGLLYSSFMSSNNRRIDTSDTTQEIISRIKFLGRTPKGMRINTKSLQYQDYTIVSRLSRNFICHDSREHLLKFIRDSVLRIFEILKYNLNSDKPSDKYLCTGIVEDLNNLIIGLNNIKVTYEEDIKFICDLDCIIQSIDAKLLELKEVYPSLFKEKVIVVKGLDDISFVKEKEEEKEEDEDK